MLSPIPDTQSLYQRFDRLKGKAEAIQDQYERTEAEVNRLEAEAQTLDLVIALFRQLMDSEISESIRTLDQLQTEGLRAVFHDQNNSVRSELEIKRGKVGIQMLTQRSYSDGSMVEGESDKAFGGAVSTVQSVLLRIFVMLRRGLRPVLLMDETLAAIEGDYILHMAQFLSLLAKRFSFDILLVTHDPKLVDSADHAYRIHQSNGSAVFKKVR